MAGSNDYYIPLIILATYIIATFIPSLAVTIRRLHDVGKNGWFYLMSFIPYVGRIIILIFTVQNGNKGSNKYGPDPKGANIDETEKIGKPLQNK